MEVIQRINSFIGMAGTAVHAERLVAVDKIIQGTVPVSGQLQAFQDTEVAVGRLALEVKPVPGLRGQDVAQPFTYIFRQ